MDIHNRQTHLPHLLYAEIESHAHSWSPIKDPVRYLSDCIAQSNAMLEDQVNSVSDERFRLEDLIATVHRQKFYDSVLLRYLRLTTGTPDTVQGYENYELEGENQVDKYIQEFFAIKPENFPEHIFPKNDRA